ncbi:Imm1 family immunity protein [Actinoplanes digitatis]|uniref:Imm1 family immunity protein n=1 Tax=Actinoplanes digitatis TaxID=1868 RepID=UPI0034DB20E1
MQRSQSRCNRVVDLVVFHYYGHWSEFPPSAAVPIADAVEAVRYFCEHGKLPR